MGSTYRRSFVKGTIWEFVGFLIAFSVAFVYYGSIHESIWFAVILTSIKIPFFFINERVWKMIKWGKIREKN